MSGRQPPTSDSMVHVYPHQSRHDHGAFAAVCVVARAPVAFGVAIALAIAAGFVKEQIEASGFGDPRSERLTLYRGGIGLLVQDSPMHCAGEMLMSLYGECHARKLRTWQTAAAGRVVESLLTHHNGLAP